LQGRQLARLERRWRSDLILGHNFVLPHARESSAPFWASGEATGLAWNKLDQEARLNAKLIIQLAFKSILLDKATEFLPK
jgi:hypothetical protein